MIIDGDKVWSYQLFPNVITLNGNTLTPRFYDLQKQLYIIQREINYFDPDTALIDKISQYVAFIFAILVTCDIFLKDTNLRALGYSLWYNKKMCILCTELTPDRIPLNVQISTLQLMNTFERYSPNPIRDFPPYLLDQARNIREMYLSNCAEIPETISEFWRLQIFVAINGTLTTLPQSFSMLTLANEINLDGNRFTTLPPSLIHRNLHDANVVFTDNPLSAETLNWINSPYRRFEYEGPQIFIGRGEEAPAATAIPCTEALREWCADEAIQKAVLAKCTTEEHPKILSRWLCRLKDTRDFKADPDRLKNVIVQILQWLGNEQDANRIVIAHTILEKVRKTCGDGVILLVNDLSILRKIATATTLDGQALKDLIISKIRYEKLRAIAKEAIDNMDIVDDVEVYLHFEADSRVPLKLPIEAHNRIYGSGISQEQIESAQKTILEETSEEKHVSLLVQDELWQVEIERRFPDFKQHKLECERLKTQTMDNLDVMTVSLQQAQEFKEKELTIWNPYFKFTCLLLKRT